MSILGLVVTFFASLFKSQRQLALENMALRQQVTILPSPKLSILPGTGHTLMTEAPNELQDALKDSL